jgi:hypothetical protein
MANLWRTQRPRFPLYSFDGNGRDYYIKYNNAGYWEDQFKIIKKPDYEYPKYSNFHSLIHQAAPVKYKPTGNGRETYIINDGGLHHDQRSLASYKLDEFLRDSKTIESQNNFKKRKHLSLGEKTYNNRLKLLEKQLINRLYNISLKEKRKKKSDEDNEHILPTLDIKKEYEKNENNTFDNKNNYNENNREERLNTIENLPSYNTNKFRQFFMNGNNKKINKISLKHNLNTLLRQSQNIQRYELKNNSRRSDNENDYSIYKNGRIGCRINDLKYLMSSKSGLLSNRINTEGNQIPYKKYSLERPINRLKKNKLTFSYENNYDERRTKTLEY